MKSTSSKLLRLGIAALLASGLVVLAGGAPRPARAQDPDALNRVRDLNKKAVDAYENLDPEEARTALMTALQVCATEGLNRHALKATTHLNLGVVLVGGFKQREAGTKQFRRALEIDPNAKVPKRLTNPEIQTAFDTAVKEIASGAPPVTDGPGTGTPPATAATPAPASPPAAPSAGGPIGHTPVTDARPNEDIVIKARIDPSLRLDRVVLAYRPEGASDFLARDMEVESGSEYAARIPEPAARGGSVAYYIEARGRGGQSLARNGSPDEPHVVTLVGADAEAVAQDDDEESPEDESGRPRRGSSGLWFSMGLGMGGGWTKGRPEVNPNYRDMMNVPREIHVDHVAQAKLLHFVPEIGYFLSPSTLVSLQARWQYTSGANEVRNVNCKPSGVCEPATGAIAVLGKATYLFNAAEKIRPFVSVMAGGGYIRYLVDLGDYLQECGASGEEDCVDTVAGGGALFGPAGGLQISLSKGLYFLSTVSALIGVPRTTFNVDLNLSLGYKM